MINQDYKSGKIIEIIREWDNTGDKYEINGMNKSLAVPFFRYKFQKYQVVPKGSYKYIEDSGNEYLVITNQDIIENAVQFQMVYIYTQESSKYIEDFPNINILTEKYNKLVQDTSNIFGYLKSVGVIADTESMSQVLPRLVPGETWYMNEDGVLASLPVADFWERIGELTTALYEKINTKLTDDYGSFIRNAECKIDEKIGEMEGIIFGDVKSYLLEKADGLKKEIEKIQEETYHNVTLYADFKKAELDDYIIANQIKLKGDKGDKGDKGQDGANGITVPIPDGRFALTVENGHLVMYYTNGTTPPNLVVENGKLYQIIE